VVIPPSGERARRHLHYREPIERQERHEDRLTHLAFVGIVFCGGSNAVAIRLGSEELAPFWAATLRFGLAAILLAAVLVVTRTALPRGRARIGTLLYGLTAFAGAYAALYWGLVEAPAGTVQVMIATVPLVTLVLAVLSGQERFTVRGVVGALVAMGGIAVIVGDRLAADVPLTSLLAVGIGVGFIALSNVIVKQIPPGHPVAANALGMAVGASVLLSLALVVGEPLTVPTTPATLGSLLYLALVGSVGLFMLTLYVLARWSASATAYATLAMPLVTFVVAALLLGETVGPLFLVGAALVLLGVYAGVSATLPRRQRRQASEAGS
jgi:drug/metabolite transporter (DMT)-like permease